MKKLPKSALTETALVFKFFGQENFGGNLCNAYLFNAKIGAPSHLRWKSQADRFTLRLF